MKNLYTIGETAEIMGLSVQTLRNYSNMGLLTPEYIDEKTGYRYYSFYQLHFIDKILYFRELGVPLSEIKKVIEVDSSEKIVELLKKQRNQLKALIKKSQTSSDSLDWYIHYF